MTKYDWITIIGLFCIACFGFFVLDLRISQVGDRIDASNARIKTLEYQVISAEDRDVVLEANIDALLTDYYIENN